MYKKYCNPIKNTVTMYLLFLRFVFLLLIPCIVILVWRPPPLHKNWYQFVSAARFGVDVSEKATKIQQRRSWAQYVFVRWLVLCVSWQRRFLGHNARRRNGRQGREKKRTLRKTSESIHGSWATWPATSPPTFSSGRGGGCVHAAAQAKLSSFLDIALTANDTRARPRDLSAKVADGTRVGRDTTMRIGETKAIFASGPSPSCFDMRANICIDGPPAKGDFWVRLSAML